MAPLAGEAMPSLAPLHFLSQVDDQVLKALFPLSDLMGQRRLLFRFSSRGTKEPPARGWVWGGWDTAAPAGNRAPSAQNLPEPGPPEAQADGAGLWE